MGTLVPVATTELRRRMRNRSALITAIVAPLAMAVVFGLLVGGGDSFHTTIGVVDDDGSELSVAFVEGLLDTSPTAGGDARPVTFVPVDGRDTALADVDDGGLDAAIIVPDGFADRVTSGLGGEVEVLRDPRQEISSAIAASVAGTFADGVSTRALAAVTLADLTGMPPPDDALAALDETASRLSDAAPGGRPLDAPAYFGASMSILFLFFTVSFAAQSLAAERASGVLGRMLAAGAAPRSIVGGKVLAVGLLGLISLATVWLVTSTLFGASWGDPRAVAATMVATVVSVGGVAIFVAGFASTARQAESYTSVVAFVLALLGGNFLGPGQAPPLLDELSRVTPNGQALRAFTAVAADEAGITDISGHLVALLAIGVGFGAIGTLRATAAARR